MRSTITARGQTVIPATIRRQLHLTPADKLEWIMDSEGVIRVYPVKADPIAAFRGSGIGGGAKRLMEDRIQDLAREEAKERTRTKP